MPIVSKKSSLVKDYFDPTSVEPDPVLARGRPIVSAGSVTNAADDSSGSMYHLIDLPSDCVLDSATGFQVENWGFAAIRIGTKTDVDALAAVLKSAGNVVSPIVKYAAASHAKPLWQVLGLAENPGGTIGLYAHAIANATGAGSMAFEVHYRYR